MSSPYTKPWLSIVDQLDRLKSYGLLVADDKAACDFLRHLNYYRFSGYGLAFEQQRHVFRPGTTFEAIRGAYYFDRALRDLVTESLEVIELDLRTAIAYSFGEAHQPFGHADAGNFFHRFPHDEWMTKLHDETERSDELFVKHFKHTYREFPDLPIWAATEIMSFGALSRMYSGMLRTDQKTVAARYPNLIGNAAIGYAPRIQSDERRKRTPAGMVHVARGELVSPRVDHDMLSGQIIDAVRHS